MAEQPLNRNMIRFVITALVTFSVAMSVSVGTRLVHFVPLANAAPLVVADLVPFPRPNPNRHSADTAESSVVDSSEAAALSSPAAEDGDAQTEAEIDPAPPTVDTGINRSMLAEAAFKIAIRLFDQGDVNAALLASHALPDPIDSKIIKWLVAVYKFKDVSPAQIDEISKELSDWPGQRLLQIRFEQAIELQESSPEAIIQAFDGKTPVSNDGTLLLARAFVATGEKAKAAALIRPRWREERLSKDLEADIREEFGELLTKSDHKARMDRMLYDERTSEALRAAADLGGDQEELAKAVVAVIKRDPKAIAGLDDLPVAVQEDPLVVYSRIQALRRAEQFDEAAKLILTAPRDPKVLVDPDAWWVERRLLAREIILKKDYRKAYRLVAGHSAQSAAARAEAEFHAGWIALEFLNEPETAKPHFTVIQTVSTRPLSESRAEYWLGRTAAASGDEAEATRQFKLAAAYPTTFYGQLALARLGAKTLPLTPHPDPDAAAREDFANIELVQVIHRLREIKRDDREESFLQHLAETLDDPTDLYLLNEMAEQSGGHPFALRLAKTAGYRGVAVDTLAFPTKAIPTAAKVGKVDPAVVYAIARQESAFHAGAVSGAGARGLLQLLPGTAKQMAKRAGVRYSKSKLTDDPAYNARLGSHFLDHLLERYDGSYVMTFAAYNAGPSRVTLWVKRYGDPRSPDVDVVNWIELIPFTETRNYVQRIMENLAVYRARLGEPALSIESDLKQGARS